MAMLSNAITSFLPPHRIAFGSTEIVFVNYKSI